MTTFCVFTFGSGSLVPAASGAEPPGTAEPIVVVESAGQDYATRGIRLTRCARLAYNR